MSRRKSFICVVLIVVLVIIYLKSDSWHGDVALGGDVDEDESQESRLFDLDHFRFTLPEPRLCDNPRNTLLGIIIVTSYVGHDDVRAAHRKGISQSELAQLGLARIFLVAQIPPSERFITQNGVLSEQRKFGDLLQGDFLESYRNLTYKHVMGLRWAVRKCSHASFIIKIDDDSVYDLHRVTEYLQENESRLRGRAFLAGYVFQHQKPIRLQADKHFVTHEEFAEEQFPKYLSGWLYLTNARTAKLLIRGTHTKKFFWIDDTYVTGILAQDQPSIEFIDLTPWFSANPDFFDCCLRDLKRFQLKCEFLVGPNGGDTQLLPLFQAEARKCFRSNACKERKGSAQNIRNTCVTEYKDLLRLNHHGAAIVRPIKL